MWLLWGAGEGLHNSRCCTAFFPSYSLPLFGPPILTSPALISMTSPPPAETWTPSTPFMLFPTLLQLHTTQKSQVFPLSLQLKGQPARFLDSPDPMTGQSPHPPHMGTGDSATVGAPWGSHRIVTGVPPHHSLARLSDPSPAIQYPVTQYLAQCEMRAHALL